MCTKCCAYEGASPFVRKCGSVAGARREGGVKGRESVDARRNEMYYVGRGEEREEEGEKPRRKKKAGRRRRKRSEKAPEEEESGAKKKEKQGKSPRGRRKRGEGEGKEGKKPRKRNEIVAWRKIWKDLYPFKGTDLCREVYSRGN